MVDRFQQHFRDLLARLAGRCVEEGEIEILSPEFYDMRGNRVVPLVPPDRERRERIDAVISEYVDSCRPCDVASDANEKNPALRALIARDGVVRVGGEVFEICIVDDEVLGRAFFRNAPVGASFFDFVYTFAKTLHALSQEMRIPVGESCEIVVDLDRSRDMTEECILQIASAI